MPISTERFMHKPVDAIRVTEENIEQVADWCHGVVKDANLPATNATYIELSVSHPTGRRTAKAFPGDWIVTVKGSFKVYNHRAFEATFKDYPDVEGVQLIVVSTIMDTMTMMMSEGLTGDEKTAKLIEIVEKSSAGILDLF